MSNRNEERLGVANVSAGDSSAAITQAAQQPAQEKAPGLELNFVTPTTFVELPSKGKYYPSGHPLCGQENIEIKHMTTKEEDILNSETLIKQGKVFDRLLNSVFVDKRIPVNSLLVCDKNAIMIELRKANYGEEYKTKTTCPKCGTSTEQSFDLSEAEKWNREYGALSAAEEEAENIDYTDRGTALIKNLPITQWTFEVKPITGVEEKDFLDRVEKRKKAKMEEGVASGQILSYTVSINGVQDTMSIAQAVNVLPAKDSKYLRNMYQKAFAPYNLKVNFSCSECSFTERMDMPLTADFFWPK